MNKVTPKRIMPRQSRRRTDARVVPRYRPHAHLCEDGAMVTARTSIVARTLRRVRPAALAAALAAASGFVGAQQPIVVQALDCRGDEPGWRLDATRTAATHTTLSAKGKREVVFRGSLQVLSFLSPPAVVWRGDSTHLPRETLVATVREESCKSTMADGPPSTHRAVLSVRPGEAVTGCCAVRAGFDARVAPIANFAVKKPDDWARLVPDLAPAINACIAREGARAKAVATAWPMNRMAGVRVLHTDGTTVECIAELSGRGTPTLSAVNAASPALPNAGNPLFYPAREPAPIVGCGRLERVLNSRGALVGYLHYDPC